MSALLLTLDWPSTDQPLARSDRMKEAKSDAQELIDAYRAEKQQEFNNKVLTAGKTNSSLCFRTDFFSWSHPLHI